MAAVSQQVDTLTLNDGSTMDLARLPDVDEKTWGEVRGYLERKPEVAKNLQNFAKNPEAMRGWLQTQAIATHYNMKLSSEDQHSLQAKFTALEQDPELAQVFEEIRKNGLHAALKYCNNEELMLTLSRKMGGLPGELRPQLQKINDTPLTLHEACKHGNLPAVQDYVGKRLPVDAPDLKGITPLGYAIGADHADVVKLLLESQANPHSVDASGNSGLHYAAGYGRGELVEFLLKSAGVSANRANTQGQTPLMVASMNKQAGTMQLLEQYGGTRQ